MQHAISKKVTVNAVDIAILDDFYKAPQKLYECIANLEFINRILLIENLEDFTVHRNILDIKIMFINACQKPGTKGLHLTLNYIRQSGYKGHIYLIVNRISAYILHTAELTGISGIITPYTKSNEIHDMIISPDNENMHIDSSLFAIAKKIKSLPAYDALNIDELNILRLIMHGESIAEIGNKLNLPESAIFSVTDLLMEKLSVSGSVEMIRFALHNKLID